MRFFTFLLVTLSFFSSCGSNQTKQKAREWIPLFNGENLEGWTVKITGYPAGENFGNTFRVEDGLLKVRYDQYDEFNNRFGHIFYTGSTFSHYKLRVEYRFVRDQVKGGPGWAFRNNGAMLHCEDPRNMHINQDFPVSIEAQMLGGDGTAPRSTGSVCTPGTEVYIDGEPYTQHCYNSKSKTYDGNQWVTMEVVVLGDSIAHHIVEGDTVMTYTHITVGGGNVSPAPNVPPGPLKEGFIAFQGESHPTDFRKIEIMDLSDEY